MNFLLSGASSPLVNAISANLNKVGHSTTLIGRSTSPRFVLDDIDSKFLDLLNSHDVFLHFAHSFEFQDSPDLNELAARRIVDLVASTEPTMRKCIYISSDSASLNAKSKYGQSKYRTERVFLGSQKSIIIRLGIINSSQVNSPFAHLDKFVKKFHFLIFPSPNKKIFTYTDIDEITKALIIATEKDLNQSIYSVTAEPEKLSVVQILEKRGNTPKVIIEVPRFLVAVLALWGSKIKRTRRFFDSLLSVMADPETLKGVEK